RSKGLRSARLGAARGGLGGLHFIVENMWRFAIAASAHRLAEQTVLDSGIHPTVGVEQGSFIDGADEGRRFSARHDGQPFALKGEEALQGNADRHIGRENGELRLKV